MADPQIIDSLNEILTAELTAINQYYVHSKMLDNWGYKRLAKKKREESMSEMKDADEIIERILYLEGVPNLQRLNSVRVGQDAVEQHRLDLEMEREAIERLNRIIELCRHKSDNGTRYMLDRILKEEEVSADWLQGQLHIIGEIGKERYLIEQMHD
ncbi:MAG TPA: bacterioferritin [Anaerolineales bacterium]|nr:bacterioferritin [Anaerolineales bacterium]